MKYIVFLFCVMLSTTVFSVSKENNEEIKEKLKSKIEKQLELDVIDIHLSSVEGLYEFYSKEGVLYITSDGKHLIQGTLYDISSSYKVVNVTEESMEKLRAEKIKSIERDYIEYKSKNEKYIAYVFTDVTCPYCQKLHRAIKSYQDAGITIRYLAFPRSGLQSKGADLLSHAWCSKNKHKALDTLMSNMNADLPACIDVSRFHAKKVIESHYKLGQSIGISGTPAFVFTNGKMIPGFVTADELIKYL